MAFFLLVGTVVDDRGAEKFRAIQADERGIGNGYLFIHDEVLPEGPAQSPVLLRPMRCQPALGADLLRKAFGECNILIGLFVQYQCIIPTLRQFRLQEIADLLPKFFLVV
jgi:hypothetical protein